MQLAQHLADMRAASTTLESILNSVPEAEARWKPAPERWSILEVVNHMADEETEDFRHCVGMLLDSPGNDWPELGSWGWVEARAYNTRDLIESCSRFRSAREESVRWLESLKDPAWDNLHTGNHPFEKPMTAGDVMVSWVAHDWFHLGQIHTLRWEHLNATEPGFSSNYAGEIYWRPEGAR